MEVETAIKMATKRFSAYKAPITATIKPFKEVTLQDLYQVITSPKYKIVTERLRSANGSDIKSKKIKENELDYVTFSGIFNRRAEAGLKEYSGLFCIDIDHLQDISKIKERILIDYTPALMFISPRGKGLKVVYAINITHGTHKEYFNALSEYFALYNIEIDKQCKDIPRATFLCHDPEAFYSDTPTVLGYDFLMKYKSQACNKPAISIDLKTETIYDFERLKTWIDKCEAFVPGNRNNYITKLAHACNRYGISQYEAVSLMRQFVCEDFTEKEINSTIRSIYQNHSDKFNTERFENDILVQYRINEITSAPENKEVQTPLLPISGLPIFLQDFISGCSSTYGTHTDFWAGAVLTASSLAIGNTYHLIGKYDNSAILWMVLVAPSGIGKTHPLRLALNPFHYLDSKEMERFDRAVREFENNKNKPKEEREELEFPVCRLNILSDATPEAIIAANKANHRGILIERDELHGWLLDFGRYNKSGEVQNWISAWSQYPMTVNRKGQSPLKISEPFISVCGGIQPEILPELARDHRAYNGFLQRFCFVYPDHTDRPKYSNMEIPDELIRSYNDYINTLLSVSGQDQIRLSHDAENLFREYANYNTDLINHEQRDYLRAVYAKLDIICLRISLIVHMAKWACTGVEEKMITPETMQAAIDISGYFKITGIKVYNQLGIANLFDTKQLIRYLSNLGNSQNQISDILKISQPYVCKILKQKNIR